MVDVLLLLLGFAEQWLELKGVDVVDGHVAVEGHIAVAVVAAVVAVVAHLDMDQPQSVEESKVDYQQQELKSHR